MVFLLEVFCFFISCLFFLFCAVKPLLGLPVQAFVGQPCCSLSFEKDKRQKTKDKKKEKKRKEETKQNKQKKENRIKNKKRTQNQKNQNKSQTKNQQPKKPPLILYMHFPYKRKQQLLSMCFPYKKTTI